VNIGSLDRRLLWVLGGLIVFSTMLGSVVEREKEIFTFSALGLAPPAFGGLLIRR